MLCAYLELKVVRQKGEFFTLRLKKTLKPAVVHKTKGSPFFDFLTVYVGFIAHSKAAQVWFESLQNLFPAKKSVDISEFERTALGS